MNVGSLPLPTASGFGQLQRQAAQRQAEQLEAQARALAAQAREARRIADEATRRADEKEIESGSARTAADNAWQAVAANAGVREFGQRMGRQAEKIAQAVQAENDSRRLYESNGRPAGPSVAAGAFVRLSA